MPTPEAVLSDMELRRVDGVILAGDLIGGCRVDEPNDPAQDNVTPEEYGVLCGKFEQRAQGAHNFWSNSAVSRWPEYSCPSDWTVL